MKTLKFIGKIFLIPISLFVIVNIGVIVFILFALVWWATCLLIKIPKVEKSIIDRMDKERQKQIMEDVDGMLNDGD